MKPLFTLTTSFAALASISGPSMAQQQRVQDFTLPPSGTPTPTPEAEGPVDEAAGVTIPPRTIPRATPTPTPAPSLEPAPVMPAAQPTPTQAPTNTPTSSPPSDSAPAARAQPSQGTPTPSPAIATPPLASEPVINSDEQSSSPSSPGFTLPTPEPIAPSNDAVVEETADADEEQSAWWIWAAGILGALLVGMFGGWLFARKRAQASPGAIERPTVKAVNLADEPAADPIASAAKLRVNLEIESLTRSLMMMTARYSLSIANRSDNALRDLKVSADLISARRDVTMEQQVASLECELPQASTIERIGPQQIGTYRGQLQLPVNEIEVFRQGQTPLCIPLVRIRLEAEGMAPQCHTFLLGIGAGHMGGRVQPLPLSGPPGGFEGVQTKRIEQPA